MSELRDLYQELILDHGRRPRNFIASPDADRIKEGFNPLCGDRLTLFVNLTGDVIDQVTFQGCGCAISMASASLMTENLKGKSIAEAKTVFQSFHDMVINHASPDDNLGKLIVLQGVAEYPARVKCATLSWHTLVAALENNSENISTE